MNPPKRALLIAGQPTATTSIFSSVCDCLSGHGVQLVHHHFTSRQAVKDAVEEHKHDVDVVIAAGGDGIVNAAVQGLATTDLPLAVVPLGTANVLARTLGVTRASACDVIAGGRVRTVDLACVNGV